MIDTVKFSIIVNNEILENIKSQSYEIKKTNNLDNSPQFNFFNCPVDLPSYHRGINIFHDIYKENKIFIELSLPKFLMGNNIYMITPEQATSACESLRKILIDKFGAFPQVKNWLVTRLDLCYSWQLENEDAVISLLGIIRTFSYPRKKSIDFRTSIYSHSEASTVKFYHKGTEFKQHDYKPISKIHLPTAFELLHLSNNLLRFEIELRKKQLVKEFDNVELCVYNLFEEKTIIKILNKYFNKQMNGNNTALTTNIDNYKKLINFCNTSSEAVHLYEFYKLLHSPIKEDREFLKHSYSKATFYRKKALLKLSKVGLSTPDTNLQKFQFSIPSRHAVNYLKPADGASRAGDKVVKTDFPTNSRF
jgi:II/X family phage/plasmid replication protein